MAGKIPQHFIDELVSRTDIVELIDQYVPNLKKKGSNHHACCPFHTEKTPSFTVSEDKQFYHCFGCGAHGTAIGFLMEHERMHFVEAIEMLAERAGVEVPREDDGKPSNAPKLDNLHELMGQLSQHYGSELRRHQTAIDYLRNRGLSGETAKTFGIGFAPGGWDNLAKAFPNRESDLDRCGMLTRKEGSSRPYDRFRERVMFPIRDSRGRVVGFGGRVLGDGEPKYLNSPETPLFHKGRELYGLYEAKRANRKLEALLVVEGYMDVVMLAQHGISNAVATLGTATTAEHLEKLFRSVRDVVFCFDGDRAGRQAAWRALNNALPALRDGREVRFLFLPDGEDPDSLVNSRGREHFEALLAQARPLADYLFDHLREENDCSSIGGRARLAEQAKPLIMQVEAGIYRQLLQQQLDEIVGLQTALPPAVSTSRRSSASTAPGKLAMTPMRQAICIALQQPTIALSLCSQHGMPDGILPGAALLQEVLMLAHSRPGATTALLLEHFRERPEWQILNRLAGWSFPDGRTYDADAAQHELPEVLQRLHEAAARQRLKALTDGDGPLDLEELKRLRDQLGRDDR